MDFERGCVQTSIATNIALKLSRALITNHNLDFGVVSLVVITNMRVDICWIDRRKSTFFAMIKLGET
jgi:hypothetical protein